MNKIIIAGSALIKSRVVTILAIALIAAATYGFGILQNSIKATEADAPLPDINLPSPPIIRPAVLPSQT